jgi:excisionase family DNA binding protein
MSDEHLLTTDEVLDYLHINLRTVYRFIKAGKIPAVRIGHQWRFRKRDIDAWLKANQPSSSDAAPDTVGTSQPRILVVDDEQELCELLARGLRLAEYQVDTAYDGPSALDQLRTTVYDLLITDLKMPGMDGLSVIREARRLSANLPVVVTTGFSTEANAIEALNLGVCGYITKPFRLARILSVAAKALGEPAPASEA